MRLIQIARGIAVVSMLVAVRYYVAWQRGDDIRIPGVGVVRRFPCGDYEVPRSGYGTIQAFAIIDGTARVAQSNTKAAVRTLVDAVFDRELPGIRCGNSLRRRVSEAERQFRAGSRPPITEQQLAGMANEVTTTAGAPEWARTSIEELHFMRMALREELPTFVGTVDSELRVSDKMSPVEAVFVLITLGKGMILDPDAFRDGPEAYVNRARERQLTATTQSGAVLRGRVIVRPSLDLATGDGFDDGTSASTSAQRLLDRLGFPR